MNATFRAGAGLLLLASFAVNAQVYRCGASNVYTDVACRSRRPVDVRPNLMNAAPAMVTADPALQGAAPLVLRNVSRVVSTPPSAASTIWQKKDSEDAAQTSRTTGMFPR